MIVQVGMVEPAVAFLGDHLFPLERIQGRDDFAAPAPRNTVGGKSLKLRIVGVVGILEKDDRPTRFALLLEALPDKGNNSRGALATVEGAFGINEII
jgi:hypothetical protein